MSEYSAWNELYLEHGHALPLERWAECVGTADVFDPCAGLAERVGLALDDAGLRQRHRDRANALIAAERVRPGAVERIDEAREMGLALAVAPSSGRMWVEALLERLRLRDRFHAIRCREDVARVKPDPALYRAVLAATGMRADDAGALEDSPNGVLAAKGAGSRASRRRTR